MVAVTETSAPAQTPVASGGERPLQPVARPLEPARPEAPAATIVADGSKPTPSTPSVVGFALHYDNDLQRLILEARDPVSGFVIVQIPPKYVVRQFSASSRAHLGPTRGTGINDAV